uniref:Taste receptor type 1 member 1-like n=1 Tax=Cynoglossus semilaevis TaxID=244447 RepID=A0A3P8WR36_CYNSE
MSCSDSLRVIGVLILTSLAPVSGSEFQLDGDYLIGGLFDIHHVSGPILYRHFTETSKNKTVYFYRRFQLMRFSVEQINNSTDLLPNVSLGYDIFDHCSDVHTFAGIFSLISVNGTVRPLGKANKNLSKVIAIVGTYTSTETLTVAPVFMMDLIPMVSYGAATSIFSIKKKNFPSFFRTVHPNKDVIEVILNILLHFDWRWVSFLYVNNDYGRDGQETFINRIKETEICLAYTRGLDYDTNYQQVFRQINIQKVQVIIVFAPEWTAEALIKSAINLNFSNKVWIAGDAWALNKKLPQQTGIRNIGTVLGVAEPRRQIPGFWKFLDSSRSQTNNKTNEQQNLCNQAFDCTDLSAENIMAADPSFSFPVYSAVYAIAHALHNVLQCGEGTCTDNMRVYPHMVLAEMKKSNFTLLNERILFDENGDPTFGSFSVVFWNHSGFAQDIGFYNFPPSFKFFINSSKIQWHGNGEIPVSVCSPECPAGYAKQSDKIQQCCFKCLICPKGTYINSTENPSDCISCAETEWSAEGSTSCSLRTVEYLLFTDIKVIVLLVGTCVLVAIIIAVCVLFTINYNSPVVRSAGGPMCFLILGCLALCSVSVFFYFGKPTTLFCILRLFPCILFFTVSIACFGVRSFQIVCIFKIGAKFPKIHCWWVKYHGQWLTIAVTFVVQCILIIFGTLYGNPKAHGETSWYKDKIVFICDVKIIGLAASLAFLWSLCCLSFIFSYMGKDLPKNYNEAKSITFCLVLLFLTWIFFATHYLLNHGNVITAHSALSVLLSIYFFLMWYFLPKCYIIIFQPQKNTQQYFQGLIQTYTKTISQ